MMKLVVLSSLLAVCSSQLLYSGALAPTAILTPHNYRGPLSLAPGQPASILGTDGRPLDTLDVNLDRAAHYTARAFAPHVLKKRSVVLAPGLPIIARPIAYSTYVAPRITTLPYAATPLIRY